MKIKLDENLPLSLAEILGSFGHEVDSVYHEQLSGHSDPEVWEAAQREQRFLITQDLDFSDVRRFIPGTYFGILLIRLHSPSRVDLTDRIRHICRTENVDAWQGCFVVVTELKVRVRRPV